MIRAIDCLTSSSRSGKASAAQGGLTPVSSWTWLLNSSSEKGEHPAVGVMDQDDLLGPEQALGDREGPDRIVGHDAAGVPDHVGAALL